MKILLNNCFIDFHINKKIYEKYKTEKGKMSYVERCLNKITSKFKLRMEQGLEIRDISITSNDFWGNSIHIVSDKYS